MRDTSDPCRPVPSAGAVAGTGKRAVAACHEPHSRSEAWRAEIAAFLAGPRIVRTLLRLATPSPAARARCEDRIRTDKDTGLRNLPLHGFAANQLWCELIALAMELTAWAQMLALHDHPARRWEPKRLRLRVFSAAVRLVKGGRRLRFRLAATWRWAHLIASAITRLQMPSAP